MERVGHIINLAMLHRTWKPIKLAKEGLKLIHIFFADDLILSGEASLKQMNVIKNCLDAFCFYSDEKGSVDKTTLCVSHNVNHTIVS